MRLSLPNSAQEQAAARSSSNRWYAWLVMVVAALTNVKAGPVQIGEGVLFLGLPIMLNEIAASRVFLARFQSICSPLCLGLFFVFVVISAGVGYAEGGFVVPSDATSILQQPGWISAARIIQLLLVVTAFAWVLKVASPTLQGCDCVYAGMFLRRRSPRFMALSAGPLFLPRVSIWVVPTVNTA